MAKQRPSGMETLLLGILFWVFYRKEEDEMRILGRRFEDDDFIFHQHISLFFIVLCFVAAKKLFHIMIITESFVRPLIVLLIFTSLGIVLEIAIVIYQPIAGLVGFNWDA